MVTKVGARPPAHAGFLLRLILMYAAAGHVAKHCPGQTPPHAAETARLFSSTLPSCMMSTLAEFLLPWVGCDPRRDAFS